MDDLTGWGLLTLAAVQLVRELPGVVRSWSKRTDAESALIVEALQRAKAAELGLAKANTRIDELEEQVAIERAARSYSDGQLEVYKLQIDRLETELTLWEGRARTMRNEMVDLYDAVRGGHQTITLPPPKPPDW